MDDTNNSHPSYSKAHSLPIVVMFKNKCQTLLMSEVGKPLTCIFTTKVMTAIECACCCRLLFAVQLSAASPHQWPGPMLSTALYLQLRAQSVTVSAKVRPGHCQVGHQLPPVRPTEVGPWWAGVKEVSEGC